MDATVYGLGTNTSVDTSRRQYRMSDWSYLPGHLPNRFTLNDQERMGAANVSSGGMADMGFSLGFVDTMPQSEVFSTRGNTTSGTFLGNQFDFSVNSAVNSSSFGTMTYQPPTILHDPHAAFRPQSQIFRNDSYSSTASDAYIKREEDLATDVPAFCYDEAFYDSSPEFSSPGTSMDEQKPAIFKTEIDTLMSTIQTHESTNKKQKLSEPDTRSADRAISHKQQKRYVCAVPGCRKAFCQKTHLEIHNRAHTGVKPFPCKDPGCGQRFSQLGNLRTHERRHTGERPYACEICGKRFAQHGNVKSHQNIHKGTKPFICKLDNCEKNFTQLGNLKSHQNKFHAETIRQLKQRFANLKTGDQVDSWEMELFTYFAGLYKNCNKGIKGRGKDRRITNTASTQRDVKSAETMSSGAHQDHDEDHGIGAIAEEVVRRIG